MQPSALETILVLVTAVPILDLVTAVLPVIFFVGGLIFIVVWFRRRGRRIEQSNSWPSVSATVLRSAVTYRSVDDSSANSNSPIPSLKDEYTVNVSYRYEVGGQAYEGDRVAFHRVTSFYNANQFPDEAAAKALADRYIVGEKAAVFYDPADPKEATLIRGA